MKKIKKTNTDLDKLDEETRTKIINEARANFDYYYRTELPKQIEKFAKEEVDYKNKIEWVTCGFNLATLIFLLIALILSMIKLLFK